MTSIKLYYCPRACSRVTMTALEMAGLAYDDQIVNIFKGEQKSPEYRTVHRSGKVPALVVDGNPITENASILMMLDAMAPDAGILPRTDAQLEKAAQRSDLVWCSATMHPIVRQIRMPMRYTDGESDGIYANGTAQLKDALREVERRVSDGRWFYGDAPSIVDVYLHWLVTTAASAGFPIHDYPAIVEHCARVEEIPAFRRAMAREAEGVSDSGIQLP